MPSLLLKSSYQFPSLYGHTSRVCSGRLSAHRIIPHLFASRPDPPASPPCPATCGSPPASSATAECAAQPSPPPASSLLRCLASRSPPNRRPFPQSRSKHRRIRNSHQPLAAPRATHAPVPCYACPDERSTPRQVNGHAVPPKRKNAKRTQFVSAPDARNSRHCTLIAISSARNHRKNEPNLNPRLTPSPHS